MTALDPSGIIGGFPDPMLLVEPDGTIAAANPRAGELFRRPFRALVGRELGAFLADENDLLCRYLRMCRRTSDATPGRLRIRLPDGEVLPCKVDGGSMRRDGRDDPVIWLRLLPQQSAFASLSVLNERLRALSVSERARIERKRATEELRLSEEQFRLLVESVHDYAIFMLDLEGHVASWNPGAERIAGYRVDEILGRHYAIFYPPEDVDQGIPDAQLREALLNSRVIDEGWRVRKDGSRFWANGSLAAIRNAEGNVIGFVKITRDLTERRRAEAALRASEERWRAMFESAAVGIVTFGSEHRRYVTANEAFQRMTGYTGDELRSLTPVEITHEDDRARLMEHVDQIVAGGQRSYRIEKRYRRKDGGTVWADISSYVVRATDSTPAFLAVMAVDITDRKRAEAALRASEVRWRTMFERFPVGIALRDAEQRYMAANPAFQKMVGYSEEELSDLGPLDITHEDDHPATERTLAEFQTGARQSVEKEKRFRRKDGAVVWATVSTFCVPEADPTPAFYPAIIVDITERKRAEEALRESELELARVSRLTTMGELAASIAHELRQPLSAAVTNGTTCQHWLSEQTLDLARARRAAQRMIAAAQRASEVMGRIRTLLNKTPPQQVVFAISDLLRETLAVPETELGARQIAVTTELAEPPLSVMGDRVQLQQVLLNLIMNGVEAMSLVVDRPRLLQIRSRREAPGIVLVAVEDSGTGLDPAIAERIFDPFFTTKAGGMGMGLSICRSIIDSHGGRLWASPAPSQGALLQFTLPIEA